MLRDASVQIESEWGAHGATCTQDDSCREVDRQLRRIAKLRPASTETSGGATAASIGASTTIEMAAQALVTLGWTRGIAARAVEAAHAHVGVNAELGTLIREALRRCGP